MDFSSLNSASINKKPIREIDPNDDSSMYGVGVTVCTTTREQGLEQDSALHVDGELRKNFSLWSVLGVGFSLTNSWLAMSFSLLVSIQSGGPIIIIYGILIVGSISFCIGATLSELSSAIPSAGGQYVWTRVLSPRKYSRFLSFLCGSLGWVGSIFTTASISLSIAQLIMAFWNLTHPSHVTQPWELFVAYQLVNVVTFGFNCYGKYLTLIANGALYCSVLSFMVIAVTVVACSKGHYQPAKFVFVDFENATGWNSPAIAFIIGLINPNWGFSGLDAATHMAEELYNPERVIPIAIMGTVAIGMITSLTYCIALFFCIRNLDDIINNGTGFAILDIIYQALSSKAGAICLGMLVLFSAAFATISSQTWQARLCWSFSRDNGLPYSRHLSKIHPKLNVPLNAHLASSSIVAILGCLYLASSSAFNSMVVGSITFLLLSYAVPTLCLLYKGRNNIKHGCFWLGNWGLFANIITVAWCLIALVFYSLPFSMPADASSMNYVSAVYGVYTILMLGYWFFPIKKYSCRANFAGGAGCSEEFDFADVCLKEL